mgnify:CR=1 FL=1
MEHKLPDSRVKSMTKIRTRYAPSPTGKMHVGNLRTALYAYLIAKHEGGDFILRIEDTDQERFVEGATEIIYNTMRDTGLKHDEGPDIGGPVGPYVQSDRQKQGIYMEYAKKLIDKGEAYYCFCDQERLNSLKREVNGEEIMTYDKHCLHLSKEEVEANLKAGKPFVIRQNNPTEGKTTFHDEIYGDISVDNSELDDMVLIKSDGFPTYNFANVVDDHLQQITHVVRGNEYLSSSPKYNRLYDAFGWEVPVYVHCPTITNEEHKKLSKRSGHSSYQDLIDQGFVSEAVVNFVALLGWSPENNQEIFSLDELVKEFNYKNISKSPAVFDMVKLKWMNGEYIKAMDFDKFYEMAEPYIKKVITKDLDLKKIAAMAEAHDVALAPHCPLGPIALASCLQVDATSYNAVIQEQSMGIHYNVGKSVLDYVKNKEDFAFVDGYVRLPVKPTSWIRLLISISLSPVLSTAGSKVFSP